MEAAAPAAAEAAGREELGGRCVREGAWADVARGCAFVGVPEAPRPALGLGPGGECGRRDRGRPRPTRVVRPNPSSSFLSLDRERRRVFFLLLFFIFISCFLFLFILFVKALDSVGLARV